MSGAFDDRFRNMTQKEVLAFLDRIDAATSPEDAETVRAMAGTIRCLTEALLSKGISIERLKAIAFGGPTEKTSKVSPSKERPPREPKPKEPKPGHGPRGAKGMPSAERLKVPHAELKPGDSCPDCPRGHLFDFRRPSPMVRFVGLSPVEAKVYERQVLRCSACSQTFAAKVPEGVGSQKYDETVPAVSAIFRFGAGFPYHRFSRFQATLGVPLAASTMNDLVVRAYAGLRPILDYLFHYAAQGELIHQDDTVMRILDRPDLVLKGGKERKGVYTTGLIAKCGLHRVALFITGMQHAGENLADLLKQRVAGLGKPIQVCDALASNTVGDMDTVVAHCLAHARRKFVEVKKHFPEACRIYLENIREVYANEAATAGMSPPERLAFHQERSRPVMDRLKEWLDTQLRERLVEPNSSLGKAINYSVNHWEALTTFLREPGVPLDNNQVERSLKRPILHRKNSMFYKTEEGARVGDLYMSLIHTAELNHANPFEYLVALMRNRPLVEENPEEWMPWNYQATLQEIEG